MNYSLYYDGQSLEPVQAASAGSAVGGAQSSADVRAVMAQAMYALAQQMIDNSEAQMKEDLYELMGEARAAALEIGEADEGAAVKDEARTAEDGAGHESPAAAQPDAQLQPAQSHSAIPQSGSTAFMQAVSAAASTMIVPEANNDESWTPREDAGFRLTPVASI